MTQNNKEKIELTKLKINIMINKLLLVFVLLVSTRYGSCEEADNGLKDDWSLLEYHFHVGALPPPYYYEYKIIISSAGEGHLIYQIGYPDTGSNVLKYSFTIKKKYLKSLKKELRSSKILNTEISPSPDIPEGGSSASLKITIANPDPNLDQPPRIVNIPSYPDRKYENILKKIYDKIKKCVPQDIWNEAEQKRKDKQGN